MSESRSAAETGTTPAGRIRALGVAGATAAALVVWALASWVAGVDVAVRIGGSDEPLGAAAIIIVSVFSGLAGWLLLAALERFSRRPRTVWTALAVTVLVLSLGAVTFGKTTGATVTLLCVHLAVGAVLIGTFARTARPAAARIEDREATPGRSIPL